MRFKTESAVLIEANRDPAGPSTTFLGDVSICLGDGNDMLLMGLGGASGNRAEFEKAVTLDGGTGWNMLLSPSGANVFVIPPVFVNF